MKMPIRGKNPPVLRSTPLQTVSQLSFRGEAEKSHLRMWNGPLQIKESVGKSRAVGITYLAGLEADVASGRFVLLKGRKLNFILSSYILQSKKRRLSPSGLGFLDLLRQAKKVRRGKTLDETSTAMENAGRQTRS